MPDFGSNYSRQTAQYLADLKAARDQNAADQRRAESHELVRRHLTPTIAEKAHDARTAALAASVASIPQQMAEARKASMTQTPPTPPALKYPKLSAEQMQGWTATQKFDYGLSQEREQAMLATAHARQTQSAASFVTPGEKILSDIRSGGPIPPMEQLRGLSAHHLVEIGFIQDERAGQSMGRLFQSPA